MHGASLIIAPSRFSTEVWAGHIKLQIPGNVPLTLLHLAAKEAIELSSDMTEVASRLINVSLECKSFVGCGAAEFLTAVAQQGKPLQQPQRYQCPGPGSGYQRIEMSLGRKSFLVGAMQGAVTLETSQLQRLQHMMLWLLNEPHRGANSACIRLVWVLAHCHSLEYLSLQGSMLSRNIPPMVSLRHLHLNNTSFDNNVISNVLHLSQLSSLQLGVRLTAADAAVLDLSSMAQLKRLSLLDVRVPEVRLPRGCSLHIYGDPPIFDFVGFQQAQLSAAVVRGFVIGRDHLDEALTLPADLFLQNSCRSLQWNVTSDRAYYRSRAEFQSRESCGMQVHP